MAQFKFKAIFQLVNRFIPLFPYKWQYILRFIIFSCMLTTQSHWRYNYELYKGLKMGDKKLSKKNTLEDFEALRSTIESDLKIPRATRLYKKQVLEVIREQGISDFSENKFDYLVNMKLINPIVLPGDRNSHVFGREEIKDFILFYKLKSDFGLSYTKIAGLLRQEAASRSEMTGNSDPTTQVGVPVPADRGIIILRSRILGVTLRWLFNQMNIEGIFMLLRTRRGSVQPMRERNFRVNSNVVDFQGADNFAGDFLADDLFGFVTKEQEVLFQRPPSNNLLTFNRYKFVIFRVDVRGDRVGYDLLIGVPDQEFLDRISPPIGNDQATILGLLLETAQLEKESSEDNLNLLVKNSDEPTPLQSLADSIPRLSPLWDYCAILTVDTSDSRHLLPTTLSQRFPKQIAKNTLVEPGQPLSGWAFQSDFPIVVQRTLGNQDPRLAYQALENATAAAAIPTHAKGVCNGVLYIGSNQPLPRDVDCFSETEIRVLRVIADVVGEMLERNSVRAEAVKDAFHIITKRIFGVRPWNELENQLWETLRALNLSEEELSIEDNLHLTVIRVDGYEEVQRLDPEIARWFAEHVLNTTQEYFLQQGFTDLTIFQRNRNSFHEFVCCVSRIRISDADDRKLRNRLREVLSSLTLKRTYDESLHITTHVWSMPFRLGTLKQKINSRRDSNNSIREIVTELVREIEEALITLPHIEIGHRHESVGAFGMALEEYLAAHYLAPQNRYLMRHIAKQYLAVGNLEESIRWWESLIQKDAVSVHYARYAYVLAAAGQFAAAERAFEKAYALDSTNAETLLQWGDLLFLQDKVTRAVSKYEQALTLDHAEREIIWLRLAQAHLKRGHLDQALTNARLVLSQKPDHREARRIMLEALLRNSKDRSRNGTS